METFLGHIPGMTGGVVRGQVYAALFSAFRGKGARIGLFTHIWFPWNLELGKHAFIGRNAYINCLHRGDLRIGNNVMIAPYAMVITTRHNSFTPDTPMRIQGVSSRKVIIEDDVWIGGNAVILPGVRVGRGSVVAASSVVNRDIPAYALAGGNPARILKSREVKRSNQKKERSFMRNWDQASPDGKADASVKR
jgi:maltose O-acetyltransferase